MRTQKPGENPRPFIKKAVRFVGALVSAGVFAWALYGSYLYADYLQFNRKTAELPGLNLYPVQESHATRAYSWYASYPKIDEPAFDRAVSKIVNDAKAAFLARVNFQAKTDHPQDDLNISFAPGTHDNHHLSVTITKRQTLKNKNTSDSTLVTYDRKTKHVVTKRQVEVDDNQPLASAPEREPAPTKIDCKKSKCIALTFNDGPNYETPKILDTLKVYKAKATFFEVGAQVKLYPSVAKRTVREGHAIGTMGQNHRNLLAIPIDAAKRDLEQGRATVRSVTGTTPQLVRAPYGAMTTERAKELGMPFVSWDAVSGMDATQVYRTAMANVREGAIITSSEISDVTTTAYTRIIPELIKRGYKLVTVPELMEDTQEPGVFGEY